ncbi:MAG: AgmX/PglI C-terminal domain-containing protein [Chitinispirillaceae bacterium]|nr:AgmX/PglI C-terminal domain-containing protein [Chitinispirillaceae bacterium]
MTFLKTCFHSGIVSLLLICIGCAFGTRHVALRNSTPACNDTLHPPRSHAVCFDGLADVRPDSTIGHVQNGYGMRTAKVVAENSVPEWVNKEIENKLTRSGYEIKKECDDSGDAFVINGKILKVYTTAYMTYLGEVTLAAVIKLNQSTLIEKKYSGHKKTGINWAASQEAFSDVLEKSLEIALSKFIKDIDSLDATIQYADMPSAHNDTSQTIEKPATTAMVVPIENNMSQKKHAPSCLEKHGGILVISGKRGVSSIKRVLDSIKLQLTSLYKDRYEINPSLSGSLCVYFTINSNGTVGAISIIQNTLNDSPIEDKLIELLSTMKFRKLTDRSENTEVTYRLVFTEQMAKASKGAMIALLVALGLLCVTLATINLVNASSNL